MKSKRKKEQAAKPQFEEPWIVDRLGEHSPDGMLMSSVNSAGRTRAKVLELSHQTAQMLRHIGVKPGMKVVVDAEPSRETLIIWCACALLGAVPVFFPVDMRFRDKRDELEKDLLSQDDLVLFVSNPESAKVWIDGSGMVLNHVISIKGQSDDGQSMDALFGWPLPSGLTDFETALDTTRMSTELEPEKVDIQSEAACFYSQGSRHDARRISISWQHLQEQASDICRTFDLNAQSKIYLDLTSHHVVNVVLVASCILSGASMVIGSAGTLIEIQSVKPTCVFMLPHHIQNIIDEISSHHSDHSYFKRLGNVRFKVAEISQKSSLSIFKLATPLIQKFCIDPIVSTYFPNLKAMISYGNDFDGKIGEFFSYMGIRIFNAFTVSEAGFVHIHEFMKSGGYLPSVDTRVKNGVLSVRPRNIKSSYLSTQDYVFEDDRLGLCSHKNDNVVLENGTHVDTTPMHDILTRHAMIDEIFIFGADRPFLTALIYLNRAEVFKWAAQHQLSDTSFESLAGNQTLYEYILRMVTACNLTRGTKESIMKIAIMNRTIEDDPYILTVCRLTRRAEVENRYRTILNSFYQTNF